MSGVSLYIYIYIYSLYRHAPIGDVSNKISASLVTTARRPGLSCPAVSQICALTFRPLDSLGTNENRQATCRELGDRIVSLFRVKPKKHDENLKIHPKEVKFWDLFKAKLICLSFVSVVHLPANLHEEAWEEEHRTI